MPNKVCIGLTANAQEAIPATGGNASGTGDTLSYSVGQILYTTITGTSQLLSVPFALHAKTAESITGTLAEKDPVFVAWNKSTGVNITASQVSDFETRVANNSAVAANTAKNSYPVSDATKLAGIATGAEVNVNADWNATSGDAQVLNKPTLPVGTNNGDMQYWYGTHWVLIPAGSNGQTLTMVNGIPTWSGGSFTVTTTDVSSITAHTATSGGNIVGDGGSGSDIGKSMAATSGWTSKSKAGTVGDDQTSNNSSGFTTLPGGNRNNGGSFGDLGGFAYLWSYSESDASYAWGRDLDYDGDGVYRNFYGKGNGFSVRCLQN